jgi:hypothetical protein
VEEFIAVDDESPPPPSVQMATVRSSHAAKQLPYHVRLLYATQSGRAKGCARRTARILATVASSTSSTSSVPPTLHLRNGAGVAFDEDMNLFGNGDILSWVEAIRSDSASTDMTPSRILLVMFVSTTGDGEQTETIQQTWAQLYVLL